MSVVHIWYVIIFLSDRLRRRVPDRINIYPSIQLSAR